MYKIKFTKQFKRDFKRIEKRKWNVEKLKEVIRKLVNKEKLAQKHEDHRLSGNYVGKRECHIEPDFLLIYMLERDTIIFERTGSHSDLFD